MRLSDKFTIERGSVYLTGIQALVRLPMDQMRRDRRAGLKTGVFISGYEGSPLGGYDLQLARSRKLLDAQNIVFRPGVNEDLAATSVMGSQIFDVAGGAKVDGVVGIWYGKGPGVDRSGDILRHANLAGTGKNGGALVLAGGAAIAAQSLVFGDLNDPNSEVSQLSSSNRGTKLLGELGTKPNVTYLERGTWEDATHS